MINGKHRHAAVALGVVGAFVAAWLLATAIIRGSDRVATSGAAATTVASEKLPRPLGRGEARLSAGLHVLDLVALDTAHTGPRRLPKIAITLPTGWRNNDGFAVLGYHGSAQVMGLAFWDVDQLYGTPCKWQSRPMVDPGHTVDGLASALASRPLRNASSPTRVTLGGFRGEYLRWSVPRSIDLAMCDQGYFESWTGLGWSRDRWQQSPGQVDRLWILNVDGQRLVVDANYLPTATARDRAALGRVVRSIRFLPVAATGQARNGAWIAYSTAPSRDAIDPEEPSDSPGSDVFMTRAGEQPILVAGRGGRGKIWNVCPAFSPDGRMLAFGRQTPVGPTIVIVGIAGDGTIGASKTVLKVPGRWARCPKWSSNSSRLAYLNGSGTVIVRGLDGSRRHRTEGDPTIQDFDRKPPRLVSPTGEPIKDEPPSYAAAGWSPDGRELLLMRDVDGGGFSMRAASVDAPFVSRTVVAYVPVNNARSWPGYGDVSWQPIPR